jgi:type IV pilus assembly protein PilO
VNLSDINWDFNAAGSWPLPLKAATIAVVCVLVAGAAVYYDTMPQLDALKQAEQQEVDLKDAFKYKQNKAINLPDYVAQLQEIEASLGEMVKQMPTKAEVASLLIDISQTGLANGLEFKLFQPRDEVHKEFYTELPIDIEVIGRYAQLGAFVSGLASLPRVVTVHDIAIQPFLPNGSTATKHDGRLHMNAVLKTYNEQSNDVAPAAATTIRKGGG